MRDEHHIEIAELVMRVPGVAREDVPALVDDVLRRVQDRLRGTKRAGHIHIAELSVRVRTGAGREALVGAIADAIEGALR